MILNRFKHKLLLFRDFYRIWKSDNNKNTIMICYFDLINEVDTRKILNTLINYPNQVESIKTRIVSTNEIEILKALLKEKLNELEQIEKKERILK